MRKRNENCINVAAYTMSYEYYTHKCQEDKTIGIQHSGLVYHSTAFQNKF